MSLNCTLTNTGERHGSELVQLYFRDMEAHVTRPVKQLCAFVRVALEPGQKAKVSFEVDTSLFGFTNENGDFVVEPGNICFMVGASSEDIRAQTQVLLTGKARDARINRSYGGKAAWEVFS